MSSIIPFNFENTEIRTVTDNGEAWVVAKDVAEALGYAWDSHLLDKVPDEWKGAKPFRTPGGTQALLCLSEQGLYFFLARSDKPKALPFQKWIAGEVLPEIRKTGSYSLPSPARTVSAFEYVNLILGLLPDLGANSKQEMLSRASRHDLGFALLPEPVVERLYTATEIGLALGVSANMVGRIANRLNLKTNEYGEFRMSKSRSSDKQVQQFHYNDKAFAAIHGALEAVH